MSENVGKTGKTEKQCVGENGRFRTFFGSMDDHIVPKTESVFSQRSQCFLRVFDYYDNVCTSFVHRFCSVSLCFSVLYPPFPLLSSLALLCPLQHTHMHTHTTDSTPHTIHMLDAHLGGCGVCFRPSHRGRRLFGWDVSEGDCSVRVTFTTMTMTAHCWCFHVHLQPTVILRVVWASGELCLGRAKINGNTEVSLWIAGAEQLHQVKGTWFDKSETVLFSTCSQTFKCVRFFRYFGEPLEQEITLRGY